MKLIDLTLNEFLNNVDSPSPTPGGGSVSAYSIAQGIGLLRMVGHLTVSKKKFKNLDENIKVDYQNRMDKLEHLKEEVMSLVDKDTDAFNLIMEAFKLPKETKEEEVLRKDEVNKATIEATKVPFNTAKLALEALEEAYPMFPYANKTSISDLGVGVMMIYAGLVGAVMNVKINMNTFEDTLISNDYLTKAKEIEDKGKTIKDKALRDVNKML